MRATAGEKVPPRAGVWLRLGTPALVSAALLLSARGAAGAPPTTRPAVTDSAVRRAIARGVRFLYSRQDAQGAFPNRHSREYQAGGEALVALALLWAGESPTRPGLRRALAYLDAHEPGHTYTRSLRAMVCALLGGQTYQRRLAGDVQWLIKHQHRILSAVDHNLRNHRRQRRAVSRGHCFRNPRRAGHHTQNSQTVRFIFNHLFRNNAA